MKLEINITKTKLFIILGAIFLTGGLIFVYAYSSNPTNDVTKPPVFGHSADETNVNIGGQVMTLQEAINRGETGGGIGNLLSINTSRAGVIWWAENKPVNMSIACPQNYLLTSYYIEKEIGRDTVCNYILEEVNDTTVIFSMQKVSLSGENFCYGKIYSQCLRRL